MKAPQFIKISFICLVSLLISVNEGIASINETAGKPEVIIIENPETPRSEKEAILILPGLGDGRKGRKHQKNFFRNKGYDLFIPDFHDHKSYEGTISNLEIFWKEQKLGEYKKLHVFAYLLGTWVLNTLINEHGIRNISSIVYDRSPIQERAPQTVRDRIPGLAKIAVGKLVIDLSHIPYPSINQQNINIGIVVESKATSLMRIFKKTALGYGPLNWEPESLGQEYDDLIYTRLNHDEMYYTFDEIGTAILFFFKEGRFPKMARREAFDWDHFKKYKKGLNQ